MRSEMICRDRSKEIDLIIDHMKSLDSNPPPYSEKLSNILKSNSILMIYNMVEATVVTTINELYENIKQSKLKCNELTKEIRQIWINSLFKKTYDKNSNFNTYLKTSTDMIDYIISKKIVFIDLDKTFHGNINSVILRDFCKEHNIVDKSNGINGAALDNIKIKRNCLAHGDFSFEELGRDLTINDIQTYYEETKKYLECFIGSVDEYIKSNAYCAGVTQNAIV